MSKNTIAILQEACLATRTISRLRRLSLGQLGIRTDILNTSRICVALNPSICVTWNAGHTAPFMYTRFYAAAITNTLIIRDYGGDSYASYLRSHA